MKYVSLLTVAAAMFSVGCTQPYHEELRIDVGSSEAVILTQTINDEGQVLVAPKGKDGDATLAAQYKSNLVLNKKVTIPYYWKQTAKMRAWSWKSSANGEWRPAAKAIIIDMSPESREWNSDLNAGTANKDQAIWVESSDSVGFSTGISITARIESLDDAVVFLSNYPPETSRDYSTAGGAPFSAEVTGLSQVMDQEVRIKVQEVFADECAGFNMDELRSMKQATMSKVKEIVIPFFKERGLTITSIGQFGGFTYEEKENQAAIDKVFQAQQDKQVAIAEASAAEERKLALQLKGEGEAQEAIEIARGKAEAVTLEAQAEAEAIKAVADAKEYELQKAEADLQTYLSLKQLEVDMVKARLWDGKLPVTNLGADAGSFLYGMGKAVK